MDTYLNEIRYGRTWERRAGGVTFWLGRLRREVSDAPRVIAAALNDDDLRKRHWRRGYGATEAEAIAHLLNRTD